MKSDADRISDLYERHAHDYITDRTNVGWDERHWLDRFSSLLPKAAAVLDIGCGAGVPIASYLIDRGFAVDGVDTSPTLIAACRERFAHRNWYVADMRRLALSEQFDGLLAWDSFFHLSHDDQRRMFPIFRRHAGTGAALLFTTGPDYGEAVGSYRGEALYHASLAPEEYRALLQSNEFRVVSHVVEDQSCGGHTVWLAQRNDIAAGEPGLPSS